MKRNYLLFFLLFYHIFSAQAQKNVSYDKVLADSLGADDYGMKSYVLVILKKGPNDMSDKNLRAEYFQTHFSNIRKLSNEGKLVVAGPLGENHNNYRGIFIMNARNFDDVNKMLQADLTIKEKIFEVEMYSLYGSAALPMYLPYHYKIEKTQME